MRTCSRLLLTGSCRAYWRARGARRLWPRVQNVRGAGICERAACALRRRAARGSAARPRRRRRGPWSRASRGRRSARSPWRCPARTRSAASALAASAAATIAASSSPPSIAARPSRLDDRRGVAALGDEPVEHLPAGADAHPLGGDERRRARRAPRASRGESRGVLAVAEARQQLAGDPVGERLRAASAARAPAASAASK